jgi:hypothetical protein
VYKVFRKKFVISELYLKPQEKIEVGID